MSDAVRVSALLLERYNLGEVTQEEAALVGALLAADGALAQRLADIRKADAEIRAKMPPEIFPGPRQIRRPRGDAWFGQSGPKKRGGRGFFFAGGFAAAALLFAALFPVRFMRDGELTDRAKGRAELSAYLKTETQEARLTDQSLLAEGSTIQLAYMVQEEGYGVIFSIDGRAAVTLHYPYRAGESTRLVPGKRTPLAEAYTLDDAPDCEIFFLIISKTAIDAGDILKTAQGLAKNPEKAVEAGQAAFKNYEVKTLTLRKP
ncbi:MAG: DUF4384 domain-containing protein [Spirochaetales bacterium]|jgi:anti-sigma factor RsiW|nr:DUF4384 domain-containing protein [Spirochaetales bacterium]